MVQWGTPHRKRAVGSHDNPGTHPIDRIILPPGEPLPIDRFGRPCDCMWQYHTDSWGNVTFKELKFHHRACVVHPFPVPSVDWTSRSITNRPKYAKTKPKVKKGAYKRRSVKK